ncbi:hypothetical protein QQ045_029333 [Rhodiola kirilowii]
MDLLSSFSHATAEDVLHFYNGSTMPGTEQPYFIKWAYFKTLNRFDNLYLLVPNLNPQFTSLQLRDMLAGYKSLLSAKVATDSGGLCRGYGHVKFGDANERRRAMAEVYGGYILRTPMRS